MDNKILGGILIAAGIVIGVIVFSFSSILKEHLSGGCACTSDGGTCPHEQSTPWQTYLGTVLVGGIAALGIYLIFFEKSQRAIVSTLEKQKQIQTADERFDILQKGLSKEEQIVLKAVREQDGITQVTLRLRSGLHKSKLSILLDGLEKKGLVARQEKGKTKQVFLRI
jgi:uncharacterized membrane protein